VYKNWIVKHSSLARSVRHAHVDPSLRKLADHLIDALAARFRVPGACDPAQVVIALIGRPLLESEH
jgi:hypothetical protein